MILMKQKQNSNEIERYNIAIHNPILLVSGTRQTPGAVYSK
jgi:hypothetical protein